MTKTDLKELKREFEDNFGTGVSLDGEIIDGNYNGCPISYDILWNFIEKAVLEAESKVYKIGLIEGHLDARRRVVEEIELELEAWFDVHFEKNRGFKSDDLFKHLQKLKEK